MPAHLPARLFALALLGGLVTSASAARADISSWMYVGGGASSFDDVRAERHTQPTLSLMTGLGSPPDGTVAVGGLLSVQPHFGFGTDLALLARIATYGYVNGGWGVAVDLGGYQRWWGIESTGGQGGVSLGGPWGLTLNALAARGTNDTSTYGVTFGIDFARLTVYRTTGENWWENPFPAVREERPRY